MSDTLKPRLRYKQLREAGIARSWAQLNYLIDEHGFPVGVRLSPQVRSWTVEEVEAWIASRPSDRRPTPRAGRPRKTDEAATAA
jgi:predicted DNA-binding transcriptional regulator AlpA